MLVETLFVVPPFEFDGEEDFEDLVTLIPPEQLERERKIEEEVLNFRDMLYILNTELIFPQAVIMWNELAIAAGDDHLTNIGLSRKLGLPLYELDSLRSEAVVVVESYHELLPQT